MKALKLSPDQVEVILQTWIDRGCNAVIEHASSFDDLKQECTFVAGTLFGILVSHGIDEEAARAQVTRYFDAVGLFFNRHWRDARGERRCLN